MKKVAVVTGTSRGLGKAAAVELARQGYHTVFTARNTDGLTGAVKELNDQGHTAEAIPLDVVDGQQVSQLSEHLEKKYGKLDVLINNAGILIDADLPAQGDDASVLNVPLEKIRQTFETNTLAPLHLTRELLPLIRKSEAGRIVNVSSGMGQMSEMGTDFPGYRVSKTGLNVLTRLLASELQNSNIKVNAVCPGWVRTDMGSAHAPRDLSEGIAGIIWAATLSPDGPTGGFFRDGKKLDW